MGRYSKGIYQPKNPSKYAGAKSPTFRSSWERKVFVWLDESPSVIKWISEPVKIPYQNPVNGKISNYIPDLLIHYVDKSGKQHMEMIEIKPLKETLLEFAKTNKDKVTWAINVSKWQAAVAWCKQRGIHFRTITEKDIFGK